ncbi:MAG TPA: ASPIC/UnbV domain-containing protein, partial [Verrucomicrobiota bacterium]|nr:ASPIC/UnbV domain-containing protein [Verrucomicrobiota bacterium]
VVTQADGTERSFHRTVSSGGSFGASTLRQEIGLGDAKAIRRVEVFWPATGIRQTLEGIEMDRFYRVREGEPGARPWKLEPISLAAQPVAAGGPAIAGRRP